MAVVFVVVYAVLAVAVGGGLVTRYRANARYTHPVLSEISGPVRYREDRLIAARRLTTSLGGAAIVLGAAGFAGVAAGADGLAWVAFSLSVTAVVILALSLSSSAPALRVYDDGVALGYLSHAEGRRRPSLSDRLGVPHHALFVPYSHMVQLRVIDGVGSILSEQREMAAAAPTRVAAGRARPMKVFGDFYARGLPHALHVRVRPERIPEVPTQTVYAGPGRQASSLSVYWPGPEFLIGVRHPDALRAALPPGTPLI